MPVERSNVINPLWRKKVDSSLLIHSGTTIPNWACDMWRIEKEFRNCVSKDDPQSRVTVEFKGKEYEGHVPKPTTYAMN